MSDTRVTERDDGKCNQKFRYRCVMHVNFLAKCGRAAKSSEVSSQSARPKRHDADMMRMLAAPHTRRREPDLATPQRGLDAYLRHVGDE
jgi:hypothetical protein